MQSRKRVHKEDHGKRRSSALARQLWTSIDHDRVGMRWAFGIVRDTARALPGLPAGFKLTRNHGANTWPRRSIALHTRCAHAGWMETTKTVCCGGGAGSGVECSRWLTQKRSLEHAFPRSVCLSYMRSCRGRFDGWWRWWHPRTQVCV